MKTYKKKSHNSIGHFKDFKPGLLACVLQTKVLAVVDHLATRLT